MVSSDNLASMEPWSVFRSLLSDPSSSLNPWMLSSNDPYSIESETMTKALSKSMSTNLSSSSDIHTLENTLTEILNPIQQRQQQLQLQQQQQQPQPILTFASNPSPPPPPPPHRQNSIVSGYSTGSGSDPETAPKPKRGARKNNIPVAPSSSNGKGGPGAVLKRKSRASKKSPTTFITADPANFREMVQQVTGVKLAAGGGRGRYPSSQILKPEPQRVGSSNFCKFQGCLPTLDTSAFLLDHHQQQQQQQNQQQQATVVNPSANGGGVTDVTLTTTAVNYSVGGTNEMAGVHGNGGGNGLGFVAPPPPPPSIITTTTADDFCGDVGADDADFAIVNGGNVGIDLDFDEFSAGFPTLESWKAM